MIQVPPVTSKMTPEQVGVIQAESLASNDVKEIGAKLEDLQKQGAKRLILDLRHCATGSPEQGVEVANMFLDKGLITYTQGQKVARQDVNANPSKDLSKLPLAVITNRGTAGGCEVAAAALLDDKRAEVVGERSYGDASVRKAITMDDGSAVILSVAKYYSPSGKAIQDVGVTPSVPIVEQEQAVDDDGSAAEPQTKPAEDLLLKKAIEVVTKGKTEVAASPVEKPANPDDDQPRTPLNVPEPPPQQPQR
jgi:carboxyl-terminal processing protease